ncbi:hypothetical protein [Amycolatopsis nivea]|uniref:hypothetical protein n=1 Tax=Amycolatopsis nivea TaxID=1644109 RepID=UPI00106F7561|nr:hypothetical protein [Amycolatopsis nivea]
MSAAALPGYCKAFALADFRRFPGWAAAAAPAQADLGDDDLGYLGDDYAVRADPVTGEPLLFGGDAPGWHEFCTAELGFAVPADLAAAADSENQGGQRNG